MSTDFRDPEPGGGTPPSTASGTLNIEVPHWTAHLRVYDNQFRPVSDVPVARQDSAGVYATQTTLSQGIYGVELQFGGKTEEKWVSVRPSQTSRIARDDWGLRLASAAPLTNTATTRETHTAPAEQWSRQTTWPGAPGGPSRIFLFVRTLEPRRYSSFADGLSLLDATGQLVADFSQNVQKDPSAGWMAFNADLPPGFYILRRGRPGVHVRQQPVYLCAGWETQVFLAARTSPSLRTLTLRMASLGQGFRPDDDSALASEALLASLSGGGSTSGIVTDELLASLLGGTLENPWLGILTAYVLLRADRAVVSAEPGDDPSRTHADRLPQVLASLDAVGDHPDVRALRLDANQPAPAPFGYPPLLRIGLSIVQSHATRFADTIPLGSLTDRVLDNLVANSAWTAWRYLDELPRAAESGAPGWKGQTSRLKPRRQTAVPLAPSYTMSFLQAAQPSAPVFRLSQAPEAEAAPTEQSFTTPPATLGTLHEVPLVQTAEALAQRTYPTGMPTTWGLNPANALIELLMRVRPEDVSVGTGLPLARVEQGFEHLRASSGSSPLAPTSGGTASTALTATEQAILAYALRASGQFASASRPATAGSADAPADTANEPSPETAPPLTLEEGVARLRAEADRLLLPSAEKKPDNYANEASALAGRLRSAADNLLVRANFMALTDAADRLLYGNGAFVALLMAPGTPVGDPSQMASAPSVVPPLRPALKQTWEAALAGAPLGSSTCIVAPPNAAPQSWNLQRTAIQDETSGQVQAYLNVFRREAVPYLAPGALELIGALLPELTIAASLFVHGSADGRAKYVESLRSLVAKIERAIQAGPASAGPRDAGDPNWDSTGIAAPGGQEERE